MQILDIQKAVGNLPSTLAPNTFYAVRVGVGYDLYLSDSMGRTAHRLNTDLSGVVVGGRNYLKQADFGHWKNGSWRDYVFVIDNQTEAGVMFRRRDSLGGQDVVFSFKIRKTGGDILKIGGHSFSLTNHQVYLDGNLVGNDFGSGVDYPNDDLVHTVVIKARDYFDSITIHRSLYIQPNRGNNYRHTYSAKIWGCKLELGTIATDWTPAPEDTQAQIDELARRISALGG